MDRPQPGAQLDRGRPEHRRQIDVAHAEAHAEPGQTLAVGGAEPREHGVRGGRPDIAEALDQQEGEAAPGAVEGGRLEAPQGAREGREMAVEPDRQPLAHGGARRPAQAVGEQRLEPRRERGRARAAGARRRPPGWRRAK